LAYELTEIDSYKMTKGELQSALAEATQTNKKTAGMFLERSARLPTKRLKRPANLSYPVLASS
jgi:hypothetical protein